MAKRTKTEQYSPLRGVLPPEEPDENQLEIRAAMDERADRNADALTRELNAIELALEQTRATEHALNVKKTAIHRLISRHLLAENMTSFAMNGFAYAETFAPVASTSDKRALVKHCIDTDRVELLSVHSGTLNAWVCESIDQALNPDNTMNEALADLGITADDTRGKENLGNEGGREAFIAALERILPPGVKANARIKLSRRKIS